jgi:hypothetical protein
MVSQNKHAEIELTHKSAWRTHLKAINGMLNHEK